MIYEELLIEADNCNIVTKEKNLYANAGRIKGNRIAIKKDMSTTAKACVLAEELGHFYTSTGDILDMSNDSNRKQELKARLWAYNKQIGLSGIIECHKAHCHTLHDLADYLKVTETFLSDALDSYKSKYVICVRIDNYVIVFEPYLNVIEELE